MCLTVSETYVSPRGLPRTVAQLRRSGRQRAANDNPVGQRVSIVRLFYVGRFEGTDRKIWPHLLAKAQPSTQKSSAVLYNIVS